MLTLFIRLLDYSFPDWKRIRMLDPEPRARLRRDTTMWSAGDWPKLVLVRKASIRFKLVVRISKQQTLPIRDVDSYLVIEKYNQQNLRLSGWFDISLSQLIWLHENTDQRFYHWSRIRPIQNPIRPAIAIFLKPFHMWSTGLSQQRCFCFLNLPSKIRQIGWESTICVNDFGGFFCQEWNPEDTHLCLSPRDSRGNGLEQTSKRYHPSLDLDSSQLWTIHPDKPQETPTIESMIGPEETLSAIRQTFWLQWFLSPIIPFTFNIYITNKELKNWKFNHSGV
jgi:hypothetical protein